MLNIPDLNQVLIMLYLRTFIGALVLSFIIAKLTRWGVLKSILITTTSKMFSDHLIAPLLTIIPMKMFFPPIKHAVLFLMVHYSITIFIEPFIHLAILRSISTLFLSREGGYNFGTKAYLFLASFEAGVIVFKFAHKYFLPSTMKYFYAYW
jgi:hypothetical protein